MKKGVIIGIIVGEVILLLLLIGSFFIFRSGKEQSGGLSGDMASGTEPFTRYPESIMEAHSEMIVPEQVPGYNIIYLTNDSLSEVETWYNNMMGNAGYQLTGSYAQEDTIIINYNKAEEAPVLLSITSSEYGTSIYLIYGEASA